MKILVFFNNVEFIDNFIENALQEQIAIIENEVDIRIQSLINDLDNYRVEFMEKVKKNKDDLIERFCLNI